MKKGLKTNNNNKNKQQNFLLLNLSTNLERKGYHLRAKKWGRQKLLDLTCGLGVGWVGSVN